MKRGVAFNIGIRFEGFKFLRFGFVDQKTCDDKSLGVQLSVDINDAEPVKDGKSKVFVKITALFVCDGSKEIIANIESVSLFGLEGVPDVLCANELVQYPKPLLSNLVSLAISTTRGAILGKGAGSFLERMPLPIVNSKEFVERMKSQENQGVEE